MSKSAQKTIRDAVTIEGIGLQTGRKASLTLKGSPPNSGINFIRTDLANKPLLNIQSMGLDNPNLKERRTTLGLGPFEIQTTEHLFAALSGLGIDNIVIEIDNVELPGMDGSAKDFVEAIKKARIVEQESPQKALKIEEPIWIWEEDSLLLAFPDDNFKISYTLSYNNPAIGSQFYSAVINEDTFVNEIASARTFCLEEEASLLLKRGLGKGANYNNTLVMGKAGPINNLLRFPNEPARHKILDLIGDIYVLGMPVQGHIVAVKSGHRLNMELVRRLKLLITKNKKMREEKGEQ